jgi:hypothetical protein
LDGSTSDVEWNKTALDYLDNVRKNCFQEGIYVGLAESPINPEKQRKI